MNERGITHAVNLTVNGEQVSRVVSARQLLVHFLRDTLGLMGTHIGCDTGNCGACTITVDGKLVKSCMMLAPQVDGATVETVEGLACDGELSVLQKAFNEHHALQCGYCTPGMLMSASYLLRHNTTPSEEDVRRAIRGNVCRCTGYVNIVKAIRSAAASRVGRSSVPAGPAEEA